MRVVCAWCLTLIKDGPLDGPVSHGICKECETEVFPDTEQQMTRTKRTVIVSMTVESSLTRTELHQQIEKYLPGTQIIGLGKDVYDRHLPDRSAIFTEIMSADVMVVIEPEMAAAMDAAITALGELTAPPETPLTLLDENKARAVRDAMQGVLTFAVDPNRTGLADALSAIKVRDTDAEIGHEIEVTQRDLRSDIAEDR